MPYMNDPHQDAADREQERRVKAEEFHAAHPEYRLLGDLHPVLRQAFVPLVAQPKQETKK